MDNNAVEEIVKNQSKNYYPSSFGLKIIVILIYVLSQAVIFENFKNKLKIYNNGK